MCHITSCKFDFDWLSIHDPNNVVRQSLLWYLLCCGLYYLSYFWHNILIIRYFNSKSSGCRWPIRVQVCSRLKALRFRMYKGHSLLLVLARYRKSTQNVHDKLDSCLADRRPVFCCLLSFCMWFARCLIIIIVIILITYLSVLISQQSTVSFLQMCLCYPCIWSACYALTFLFLLSGPWVVAGQFCFSSSRCWNVPPSPPGPAGEKHISTVCDYAVFPT